VTIALVRPPSSRLAEGIVTHIARATVDVGLAERQWTSYVDALRKFGWQISEVPTLESAPDSVFIEDTVVMFDNMAVIARPGDDRRKPEVAAVEVVVRELGCRVEHIIAPGTLTPQPNPYTQKDVYQSVRESPNPSRTRSILFRQTAIHGGSSCCGRGRPELWSLYRYWSKCRSVTKGFPDVVANCSMPFN